MLNIKKRIISINFHNEKIKYFKYNIKYCFYNNNKNIIFLYYQ